MTKTREEYNKEFSEAMKIKLKLNRTGRLEALRRSIAEETVKKHPKADIEKIMIEMEKMGFWQIIKLLMVVSQ